MDFVAEMEELDEAMNNGPDLLQEMIQSMWIEIDDLTVPDPNGPDLPQDILQVWLEETVNPPPGPQQPQCNPNKMEPMVETIKRETKKQIFFPKQTQCNPSEMEFRVETIKIETKYQLPVPKQPQCNSCESGPLVETIKKETKDPLPVPYTPQCNPSGLGFMVDTSKRDKKDQLNFHAKECAPNRSSLLQAMLEALEKTANQFCVPEQPQFDPSGMEPIMEMIKKETNDQLHVPAKDCEPNRVDTLQAVLEELRRQPANCLPVPQESLYDFHPPPPSTFPEEQCFDLLLPPFSAQLCSQPDHGQNKNMSAVMIPQCVQGNLFPVTIGNGELVYAFPHEAFIPTLFPSVSPPNPIMSRRRKGATQQNNIEKPYIKKPLNAFMLFRQEQRLKVVTELNVHDSAIVNSELGKRWAHLPKQEKNKYFQEADRLRDLHEQRYPEWSTKENYGRKRKRIRRQFQ
ncbi:hypothetical protein JOB18_023908 [Solea senegalensis]|uniref:HMG box domain-containing protein n=1 Tax=Solea senegalensis TaxID=28829 RepID=A0AAV6RZT1_SOLSE|nr:hypothetical protein JOB18_023908 [Solea senegalensis]